MSGRHRYCVDSVYGRRTRVSAGEQLYTDERSAFVTEATNVTRNSCAGPNKSILTLGPPQVGARSPLKSTLLRRNQASIPRVIAAIG